jgi:hypothetical protein
MGVCLFIVGFVPHLWAQQDDVNVTYHRAPSALGDSVRFSAERNEILSKICVGGMASLAFGSTNYIDISPDVSYHFNRFLAVGAGGTYTFYNDVSAKASTHIFGARTFVEGHFFNYLGLYADYHLLNYDDIQSTALIKDRIWSNNVSMGGGFYRRSNRLSVYFYLLYVISDKEIFHNQLSYKVGFGVFLKESH